MKQILFKLTLCGVMLTSFAAISSAQTTREFFDNKGHHLCTIAYYDERGLSSEVRSIVKPVYYDYTIKTVEEVRLPDRSIYYIEMEDATTLKTVRVANGEMELVNSLVRADPGAAPHKL
jgi:hypothetical protein